MAFYGRTYTLGSPDNHGLHAPVKKWDTNGGLPGKFTNESGFLSYFEFCQEEETWTKDYDKIGKCPYAYKSNQWVGYEDSQSLKIKMDWMRSEKYGGAMIWALDLDDYRGVCGEKDALFNTLYAGLENYNVRIPPAHELTTTKKPNEWWSPPTPSSTTTTTTTTTPSTTTRTVKTTRYTEPTTPSTSRRPATPTASSPKPSSDESTSGQCPADSTGQLLSAFKPHPTDSSLYLWCINGKDLVLSCPPTTEWNNVEKQCVSRDAKRLVSNTANAFDQPDVNSAEGSFFGTPDFHESARIQSTGRIIEVKNDDETDLSHEVVFVPRLENRMLTIQEAEGITYIPKQLARRSLGMPTRPNFDRDQQDNDLLGYLHA